MGAADWADLLTFARDDLGCVFFDWLTGVDEPPGGFAVVAHVFDPERHAHLLLRTRVPRADPRLPSVTGVYRGADWHERETFEMFGVVFEGHPHLVPLLLPDGFEGHPLRKDFVLAARVAKPWPGAKEPGESGQGSPSRRKTLPPGVPTDWGPPAAPSSRRPFTCRPAWRVRRSGRARPFRHAGPARRGGRTVMAEVLDVALRLAVIVVAFLTLPLIVGQTEHKVMAHMQVAARPDVRRGVPRLGAAHRRRREVRPEGGRHPGGGRPPGLPLAPAVALVPYLAVMVVIPVGPGMYGSRPRRRVVLRARGDGHRRARRSIMAGWSSANKYSVLGGIRSAAQLMSYELPLVLAASSVAMAAGTLSLPGIVAAWQWWWLPWQAIGGVVFFVAGLAELRRPPFDMPIAESEIIMGPMTEYTGIRFALFMLAEYAGIVVLSALTAVLFLGGWQGPLLPGPVWTLIKMFALAFVVIWVRVSLPAPAGRPAAAARLDGPGPARPAPARPYRRGQGPRRLSAG